MAIWLRASEWLVNVMKKVMEQSDETQKAVYDRVETLSLPPNVSANGTIISEHV